MDASTLASQGAKLIEAFEKSTASPGAELKSNGPLAPPDASLVQEFDAAMQAAHDPNNMAAQQINRIDGNTTQVEGVNRIHDLDNNTKNKTNDVANELRQAVSDLQNGKMTPEQLLRIQHLSGLLKFSVESGNKFIQNASQGVDSLLKQQG